MNALSRVLFAAVFPLALTGGLWAQPIQEFPSAPPGNRVEPRVGTDLMEMKDEGFVSLFDGKTLTVGRKSTRPGALISSPTASSPRPPTPGMIW